METPAHRPISVIIPTYNEEANIGHLVAQLRHYGQNYLAEIIVVDTPGQDNTAAVARQAGARVLISDRPGRAYQMNAGAAVATGEVLYFVHADVHIHPDYVADIQQALDEGYSLGCYRSQFDKPSAALRFNAYCTRFDRIWCRGGDQTLFIPKALFWSLGGYREDHLVMEDYEFILRARRQYAFKIIPKAVVISTRKYLHNSYLRVNLANAVVMSMYFLGYSQQKLIRTYKYLIQVEKYGLSLEKRPASPPLVNHTP